MTMMLGFYTCDVNGFDGGFKRSDEGSGLPR
eukprot:CAMPEP_0194055630 /NCGR_PEP_ID=MMETSP0009_2-20130614/57405_1 /TAXON_ID=210454 /ORGANISM="Grammatophora oceanica, Strain CCMP 410" /LENGTH=30 /DNA_ID= /DNA_START= /DNA_END= /DNA_ORIENTATION=